MAEQSTQQYPHTMLDGLRRALMARFDQDDRTIMLGEDIAAAGNAGGVFGVSAGFLDRYGADRIMNMPISETGFVGMGVGAAMMGLRPVVEVMFCDFLTVCMDPILSAAAKAVAVSNGRRTLPLVIRTTMGAGDGSGAVHSQSWPHIFASMPGLSVALPYDGLSAEALMRRALAAEAPTLVFEHKGLYGAVDDAAGPLAQEPGGMWHLRAGDDVTVVAFSRMARLASAVADRLAPEGIGVDVIAPGWIEGPDSVAGSEMLAKSLERTGRLLVVDEGAALCGLADHVVSLVARQWFGHLRAAPVTLTPPHAVIPYAPTLEADWLVDETKIERAVQALIGEQA